MENEVELFDFSTLAHGIDVSSYSDREKIEILEWIIGNKMDNIVDELPIREFIHSGIFYKEMDIPAGVVLTGKIHMEDHLFILLKGQLSVMTDDGMKILDAPHTFSARAGIKKIGYAHTDVVCATIHTTKRDNVIDANNDILQDSDLTWVDEIMRGEICLVE